MLEDKTTITSGPSEWKWQLLLCVTSDMALFLAMRLDLKHTMFIEASYAHVYTYTVLHTLCPVMTHVFILAYCEVVHSSYSMTVVLWGVKLKLNACIHLCYMLWVY